MSCECETDLSVCCMLHPQYKASCFHKAGWPLQWIIVAEDLLSDEWESNHKPEDTLIEKASMMVMHSVPAIREQKTKS